MMKKVTDILREAITDSQGLNSINAVEDEFIATYDKQQ